LEHPEQIYCRFPLPKSGALDSYLHTHRAGNCCCGDEEEEEEEDIGLGRGDKDTDPTEDTRGRAVINSSAADFIVSLAVVLRTSFTPFMNCERRAGPSFDILY
jgi:hypothetical protein